ncbi:MFS transporter [Jeotgalibacillus sp. S-D1]|uniref:MFS transporter n=1 Tax=Jeotgalibacillus sp. S-D1 TaxID=2552189 RepID=UPI00105A508D|nr:MFS transporter [Jeotgalibacillus sp. S-D1]TDL31906.1 MFS transporter [Jeotgalibacillus sp. S-D1]
MRNQKLWSRDFILIAVCNFFLFLAFYYLIVTLPIYTIQSLNGSEAEAGLLITVFLLSAILIRPFAGKWLASLDNRTVLFVGLFIFGVGSALYMVPDTVVGLMIVRLLHGFGFGIATTATGTIVADVIPEGKRGEGMGYYALSLNLAVVLGPFLGLTAIHQWSTFTLFSIVFFCSMIAVGVGLLISATNQAEAVKVQQTLETRKLSIVEKTAVPISVTAALFAIIYSSILSFVPVYAEEIGLLEASSYFFVVYALVMLLSRPFTGKWLDLYGANIIVYPSIVLFAIGLFMLSLSQNAFVFLLSAALIGLGWGTLFPTFQTISVQRAAPENRGLAMATFLSIFDLGIGAGSFIVGIVVAQASLHSFYFYGSFVLLLGIGIYNILHGRRVYETNSRTQTG